MTRSHDKERRRRHRLAKRRSHQPARRDESPAVLDPIAAALVAGHPLDLLTQASGILDVLDDRHAGGPERAEFLSTLLTADTSETTALLLVWQHLTRSELEARTIARALTSRHHRLPAWLGHLGDVRVTHVAVARDVYGDSDQYMLQLDWPDGTPVTITAMLDANTGYPLVDSMTLAAPLSEIIELATSFDAEVAITDADPAETRARVQEAIEHSALFMPPIETDSWPMARPLLEWALRLLPEGGSAPPFVPYDPERSASIAADFASSAWADGLEGKSAADIVEDLCWFAEFNSGDPYRWSPSKVEQLLCDWWARKTTPDSARDAAMPDVLKAFVRYCAARTGLSPDATGAVVSAVDEFLPEYRQAITSPRVDTASMLARIAAGLPIEDDEWQTPSGLELLADKVGGRQVLDSLDTQPLPDEPFDWAGVPDDVHPKVASALALLDPVAEVLDGVEFRTACRRLLARLASHRPALFHQRTSDAVAACAVATLVASVNDLGVTQKSIAQSFGLNGAPSARVATFRDAARESGWTRTLDGIAHVGLLTSSARRDLIEMRDFWREREE